jgi:hypothetical protein
MVDPAEEVREDIQGAEDGEGVPVLLEHEAEKGVVGGLEMRFLRLHCGRGCL